MNTKLKISNVTNSNKYKGAYERIFSIVNQDRIFVEVHEAEESVGLVGDTYFLELSEAIEPTLLEAILKIKNVESDNN
jgi:hypothetical protein